MKAAKFYFILAITLVGCATTAPVEKKNLPSSQALDEQLKKRARELNFSVHGILESQVKDGSCSSAMAKVNVKWNWVDAVSAANTCVKAHDLGAVEKIGNQLSTKETSTPWGPYFLSRVALDQGHLDRALWMAELSLRRAPEAGVIHYLKGQIQWAMKDYRLAAQSFEQSILYDPNLGSAHLVLGQLYLRDQDYSKAAPRFASALKLMHDNVSALQGEAESQAHLGHPMDALDAYVRLSELDSTDGQYLTKIGELYEGVLNNPERALNAYQKLQSGVKAGKIKRNIDPDNEAKIKELSTAVAKNRSVASSGDKGNPQKGEKQ